ncbi:hypothetical protein ACH4U6_06290 [Streptomyces netropsis]|uniref:hypothetical protein n=1 Tax=Streptomyces netropsis TaxID=55404 RepID=UPI0037BA097C
MPQHRRRGAAALLLLLLAVLSGPALSGPVLSGAVPSAYARAASGTTAAVGQDTRPEIHAAHAVRADSGDAGGTCRPQDLPLKGAEAVVPAGHGDPLTGPAATRTAPPAALPPPATAPRPPPAPVAGCAELLPVLRI